MEIINSGSTSKGIILRVIQYNTLEQFIKGYPYGVKYISDKNTTEKGFQKKYQALDLFELEMYRNLLSKIRDYLKVTNKLEYFREHHSYLDVIMFLTHCYDLECVKRPPDYGDGSIFDDILIINFKRKRHIHREIIDIIGRFKKYVLLSEESTINMWVDINPINSSIIQSITINLQMNGQSERILRLDAEHSVDKELFDTSIFIFCYASNINH